MPINKCIRVAESEQPAKIDYLRKSNFLSEFSTALDKAKVRQILGIPESASFFWQDLQGLPQKNTVLVDYITNKLLPINNRINDLQTTINGLSESYQEIVGWLNGESIGDLVSSLLRLEKRVGDAETNINQNSALISLISGGGSADLSNLSTQVDNLRREVLSKVSQETLSTTLLSYQQVISDLSAIRTNANRVEDINNRLTAIEFKLADNQLDYIELNQNNFEITSSDTSQSLTLRVFAKYTKAEGAEITTSNNLTVYSSNQSIVSWTGGVTNNIQIASNVALNTTVTLTFSYTEGTVTAESVTATILVRAKLQELPKQYVGCGTEYGLILGNSEFAYDTIEGAWNSTNIKIFNNLSRFHLFIITTQTIDKIRAAIGEYNLLQVYDSTQTYNNESYKIYVIRNLRNTNFEINITLK